MEIFLIKLLQLMLAIGLLVLLHEGGHFFFAKLFGVRVTRFYLFFNPKFHIASTYDTWVRRLFKMKPEVVPTHDEEVEDDDGKKKTVKVKDYVGTEYGIGWLPLGGYCAISGMIDETNQKLSDKVETWEFRSKPAWQRLLIMVGGVLVNFLLALFIYSMILYHWGETYVPVQNMHMGMRFNDEAKALGFQDGDILLGTERGEFKKYDADLFRMLSEAQRVDVKRQGQRVSISMPGDINLISMLKSSPRFVEMLLPSQIDSVAPGTPAAKAGLQAGDKIVALNGNAIDSHNAYLYEVGRLADMLTQAKTPADSLGVRTVSLAYERAGQRDTVQAVLNSDLTLGFVNMFALKNYKPVTHEYGFFESFPAGIKYGWNVLSGYVDDLKYVFTADGAKSIGGFGAIGNLFPAAWDWHRFWEMTAFLSIILAFMNILPIPALDGGHVLFLLYEMITRRKPSDEFMIRAEYFGFGIVILLMIVANLNDILRWMGYM